MSRLQIDDKAGDDTAERSDGNARSSDLSVENTDGDEEADTSASRPESGPAAAFPAGPASRKDQDVIAASPNIRSKRIVSTLRFRVEAGTSAPYAIYSDILSVPSRLYAALFPSPYRSHISLVPRTIQRLSSTTTLFVWHCTFHPGFSRRFIRAGVSVWFTAPDDDDGTKVRVLRYAPRHVLGAYSTEDTSFALHLDLPVQMPAGPVGGGVKPGIAWSSATQRRHAFAVSGSARGVPPGGVVWTLEENASGQSGLPSEVVLGVEVEHEEVGVGEERVWFEAEMDGWTVRGGTRRWQHHLQLKAEPRCARRNMGEKVEIGDEGVKGLFKGWTGEVEVAVGEEWTTPIVPTRFKAS
ncbi:hypothetical protein EJ06DRAFT_534884 [Trichodelitschia bisporula]|uniref:Uncharacterized protein n=1 Tax=Trichodelitschia bisporula TaxID=703511 RepID=A0A6G1HHJ4_9PEZI|nr:hypothetical protein EJ06DRAFT_534884 [Trichodelitschia bisporula]